MASYFDKYEIDIKIDNQTTNFDPSTISFSLKESIHELYPFLTLEYKDYVGFFPEYLFTLESIPITISFGLKNSYNTTPFILFSEELIEILSNNYISGINSIRAIHDYYNQQEIKSIGYQDTISNIIQTKANSYSFYNTDIESTFTSTYWYQTLITDADFMLNRLLPNCYSDNNNKSPFFLYITLDNVLHLKSYSKFFDPAPKETYFLNQKNLNDVQKNVIQDIKKFKPGSNITKPTRNRYIFNFSKTNGSLLTEEDGIGSYPQSQNKNLPLFSDTKKSSYLLQEEEQTQSGEKDRIKGQKINSMKNSLFLEQFLITIYLNTELHAGDTIKIEIPHFKSTENETKSMYWSDILLIEELEHVWDSSNNNVGKAYTQLLCSRKYLPNLPITNYQLVQKVQKT